MLTVLDGNGQVFPGALAVAESENAQTWRWFLALVRTAFSLEDGRGVVVLSDREKGIDMALSELLPNASHSFCVYHIMKNVKSRFHTSLNGLLFAAANAPTIDSFNKIIAAIKELNVKAGEYIENIDPSKWARSHFPARRFGHITSNVSESMNWWLEDARHLHPVGLFCCYIDKLNQLFERRRDEYTYQMIGQFPSNVEEKLQKSIQEAKTLCVVSGVRGKFRVQRLHHPNEMRNVSLAEMVCSCGFFTEHGVPCRHLCAAALSIKLHTPMLVIPELRVEELRATYDGVVMAVDLNELVDDGLAPPIETKRRGRPKQKRIQSSAEKKPKRTVTCGRCGKTGHNARTCKTRIN